MDWDGLRSLWTRIGKRKTPGWPSGTAFEHLVLRAFELDGAEVRWPYRVSYANGVLEQIDGVIYFDGLTALVESKDETERVDVTPIAKLQTKLKRRPAPVFGVVFSASGFTFPAQEHARFSSPQTVILWEGAEIGRLIQRPRASSRDVGHFVRALKEKWRFSVEHGSPYFIVGIGEEAS